MRSTRASKLYAAATLVILAFVSLAKADDTTANTSSPNIKLTLLKQFPFEKETDFRSGAANIVFDTGIIYLSSPDGVVYKTSSLDPKSKLMEIFHPPGREIARIYVFNHVLYVLVLPRFDSDDHVLYQSTDRGETFEPIDEDLRSENPAEGYLTVTELFVDGKYMFVNAGGGFNFFVSDNDGENFYVLSGEKLEQVCYHSHFQVSGQVVVQGGECKLDIAFLNRGVLSKDKLSLAVPFASAKTPPLGNRKINVIERLDSTPLVLAGAEGAILRSLDGGRSFRFVLKYPLDGYYPYVGTILFPTTRPGVALAGGWEKGRTFKPFLSYGAVFGTYWKDVSPVLKSIPAGIVTQLTQDSKGSVLAVVVDVVSKKVLVYQVTF